MLCNEFLEIYNDNLCICDLRDSDDFILSHIPNSININHIDLVLNPYDFLNSDNQYYIICYTGLTSSLTVKMLNDTPFKLICIEDGFENWKGPVDTTI